MIEKMTQRIVRGTQRLKFAVPELLILVVFGLLFGPCCIEAACAQEQPTPQQVSSTTSQPDPSMGPLLPNEPEKAGQTRGLHLYTKFEGSLSSDGQIMDINTSTGYNFNKYLGVGVGVPLYFVSTSTSISTVNPSGVSGTGIGNVYMNARLNVENPVLNFGSTISGNAPTGDSSKGQSTGQWTWTWDNSFSHDFDHLSPFVDVGIGNTVSNTTFHKRPFTTLGHAADLEGGLNIEIWRSLSFSASLYDVEPWGPQTLYSFFVRKAGTLPGSRNPRDYQRATVVIGGPDVAKDNGYNLGVTLNPTRVIDFSFGFSHSVRLKLDTVTWGVGFNVSNLVHRANIRH